jgi:hypothetical protein
MIISYVITCDIGINSIHKYIYIYIYPDRVMPCCVNELPQVITYEMIMIRAPDNFLF